MTTMDPNEITRVIDGVYKNILENFNPSSRQMIATGKAYLKSLQGASAACSLYLEALVKLSRQAQQSSLGCAGDIGSSLMQATEVFKEIHTQQLSTLKAFYVDFLVPLETNLEKDTRVIQNEQKKFLMCHKQRIEGFSKAASNAKKVRKKSRKSNSNSSSALDKEIKVIQNLEDERTKLETFCENSLKEALTQERRRYGFILERKTSLAKHYLAFYSKGNTLLNHKVESWLKVAKSREALPETMQATLLKRIQGEEDCIFCNPPRPADDTVSISSQLRKTKSMDASEILNMTSQQDVPLTSSTATMNRAKSDLNIGTTTMMNGGMESIQMQNPLALPTSSNEEMHHGNQNQMHSSANGPTAVRPKSLAVSTETSNQGFAKALYAYLSSGENQLCFLEGDTIALIGEKNKGWQFGENLRTTKTGWFPVAYTEFDPSCDHGAGILPSSASPIPLPMLIPPLPTTVCSTFQQKRLNLADVMVHRTPESIQMQMIMNNKGCAGLKSPKTPTANLSTSTQTPTTPTTSLLLPNGGSRSASDSLHSSNDSGFSNASQKLVPPQPPQPVPDYSDACSDEEPQLSNSDDLNSGDKWLMDRYQKSECARLGEVVGVINNAGGKGPRRSLSFGNISASGDLDEDKRKLTNQEQRFQLGRAQLANQNTSFRYPNGNANENQGGALQKFLTRTKSLIWKRGQNNERNEHNARLKHRQSDQMIFESISNAGSLQDLWGSHTSIVGASGTRYDKKNNAHALFEMKPIPRNSEREFNGRNIKKNGIVVTPPIGSTASSSPDPKMEQIPLPPPPPPPPNLQNQQQRREELAIPPPLRRPQTKTSVAPQQSIPSPNSSIENEHCCRAQRASIASNGHCHNRNHHQEIPEIELDLSAEESVLTHHNKQHSEKLQPQPQLRPRKSQTPTYRLSRVESFSGSEAPIIPMERSHNNNFKNRAGSGRRHGNGQRTRLSSSNNGGGRSSSFATKGTPSRHSRYIIASKVSMNNSDDNDNDDNFEDEEGFSSGNENENDFDDNASSVFVVETPIDKGLRSGSASRNSFRKSVGQGHGQKQQGMKSQSVRINSQKGNVNNVRALVSVTGLPASGKSRNGNHNQHSPSPSITKMSATVEKSVNVRGNGKRASRIKGAIHSEFHTVELITSDGDGGEMQSVGKEKPIFDYGSHIHRRLYYPERSSRMDQKSERSGNLCGPWYDLWGIDPSVSFG